MVSGGLLIVIPGFLLPFAGVVAHRVMIWFPTDLLVEGKERLIAVSTLPFMETVKRLLRV